mmetsp:Transcript_13439/g.24719  ORF Transcript_13439/g.24719 Transcript_13439/m.24719 type:complete len:294 (-) Transcript_13439:335-1216(-)
MLHLPPLSKLLLERRVELLIPGPLVGPQPSDVEGSAGLLKAARSAHVLLVGLVPLPPEAVVHLRRHSVVRDGGNAVEPSALRTPSALSSAKLDAEELLPGVLAVGLGPAGVCGDHATVRRQVLAQIRLVPVLSPRLSVPDVVIHVPLHRRVLGLYLVLLLAGGPREEELIVRVVFVRVGPGDAAAEPAGGVRGRPHALGPVPRRLVGLGVVVVHLLRLRVEDLPPGVGEGVLLGLRVVVVLGIGRGGFLAPFAARSSGEVGVFAIGADPLLGINCGRRADWAIGAYRSHVGSV